ncbi:MAG: glycosyltransferase [Lachnospiraceae bacterium]|nr:glycosyltransferase [Lachnospiraceae bacterium]
MGKLVSIIVPVYNVEKYLDRCIESLIGQTYPEIEIILVDDKSPDSSGAMCDKWAEGHAGISVVHKEVNEGLGLARNTGLEHVKGDYILFVDSDDYVEKDLCRKAVDRLEESGADICYFGHKKDYGDHITESDLSFLKKEYTGDKIITDFLSNTLGQAENESGAPRIGMSAWRILYRAEVIKENNLRFCSEREYLNEDLFFRIKLVQCISKVAVIHENLYYYCYNGASLTTRYRKDRFEASKRMYEKLCEETAVFDSDEIRRRCERAFMNNLMVCVRQEVKFSREPGVSAGERLREICSDEVVQKVLASYPLGKLPVQPRMFYRSVKSGRIAFLKILVKLKG